MDNAKKLKFKFYELYIFQFFAIVLIFSGAILNITAIAVNGGKMPVYENSYEIEISQKKHFVYDDFSQVNNPLITDIFKINGLYFSLGDTFMYIGFPVLIGVVLAQLLVYFKLKKLTRKKNR